MTDVRPIAPLARLVDRIAAHRAVFLAVCWALIVATGLADHFSGTLISLGPFYVVPIALGTWYLGDSAGAQLLAGVAVAGFLADVTAFRGADILIPGWNAIARIAVFAFVAVVVGRVRRAYVAAREDATAERDRAEELREADDLKNTFLSAVSHELRTPIAAILGSARTLQDLSAVLEESDRTALLDAVVRNARKLDRLVSDLLDMDRLSRDAATLETAEVDLAKLVLDVVSGMDIPEERTIRVETSSVRAMLDAGKVERIVENLVSNALKYSPSESPVFVSVSGRTDQAVLAVEDRGPGVPVSDRERVFDTFWRASTVGRQSGVGVGLSLVRAFAELHGGRAWVEDASGGGARFVVALPRLAAVRAVPAVPARSS